MTADQREKLRQEYLFINNIVCVAYCDKYGSNKEIKVGIITNIDNNIIEVMVQSQYSTNTITDKVDSARIMPIIAADKIGEQLREKANQKKDKLERKKRKSKDY